TGYRSVAKLAVRPGPRGTFSIGLFRPGSHRVVDIRDCPLHRPEINGVIALLRELLPESELTPYNEETHEGDLRYVQIRSSHVSREMMLTFVVTTDQRRRLRGLVSKLKE